MTAGGFGGHHHGGGGGFGGHHGGGGPMLKSRNPAHESNRLGYEAPHSGSGPRPPLQIYTGHRLSVFNLAFHVTEEEIETIFSKIGEVKHVKIGYDKSGRSNGTAIVTMSRESEAHRAVNQYDRAVLDGKPITVQFYPRQ
eukprot:gene3773-4351_t